MYQIKSLNTEILVTWFIEIFEKLIFYANKSTFKIHILIRKSKLYLVKKKTDELNATTTATAMGKKEDAGEEKKQKYLKNQFFFFETFQINFKTKCKHLSFFSSFILWNKKTTTHTHKSDIYFNCYWFECIYTWWIANNE